jgi:hypothetical protein
LQGKGAPADHSAILVGRRPWSIGADVSQARPVSYQAGRAILFTGAQPTLPDARKMRHERFATVAHTDPADEIEGQLAKIGFALEAVQQQNLSPQARMLLTTRLCCEWMQLQALTLLPERARWL